MSSEPAGEPLGQRASVLVATSDSATRELLRRLLHVGAVEVVDASDGLEAVALARRLDLDLIVLDAFLAVMDGITVCGRIRALGDVDQPPIIIVGLISERAIEVALSAGADESLSKPLNPAVIRNRVRILLTRRQAEKRLSLLKRALDLAPAAITLLDARTSEYSVAFANPAFLELSGYSADEIVGHNLRLLIGPDTDVAAMTELRDAMAEGRASRVLLRNYRKDGRPFWNDLACSPILDGSGRLTHFVAVQHDVTSIVEAPESENARAIEDAAATRTRELEATLVRVEARRRFTETVLNSMVSAILATDARGTVTFANLAALQTLGTSLADCVGRSVVELFGHNEGVADVVRGAAPRIPEHRLDFPMISPGGARFYVGMSITPPPPELRDEVGFIFIFRNLAETIESEVPPGSRPTGQTAGRGHGPDAEDPARPHGEAGSEATTGVPEVDAPPLSNGEHSRRPLLTLRYTSAVDLVRRAIEVLAGEHATEEEFIRLEASDDVPEILVDRQQISEALVTLLASTLERCGAPAQVRVRVARTEAPGEKTAHPSPAVRIEILLPQALITESDLRLDEAGRRYRRADLAIAEKLIEANGGRLILPARDDQEQRLTVLLRGAR